MNTTHTNTAPATLHAFERAGLGKAPFRYVGPVAQDMLYGEVILNRAEYQRTGIAITTKPGGTCDFCGAYIVNMFQIESADGRRFKVGSDCVAKVGDAGLRKVIDREVARRRVEASHKRADTKIAAAVESLARPEVRAALSAEPHPNKWRAEQGGTLADWCDWMLAHAGRTGKGEAAKVIAEASAEVAS